MVQLAKSESLASCDVQAFVRQATEAGARALPVQRVGVWLFNQDHSTLRCQSLFELSVNRHKDGAELKSEEYPRYFTALERGRALVAHDARNDPDTSEFTEGYLAPNGIASMLDAPIRGPGGISGVVCCEHVGPVRVWTANGQDFAASIADMASLAIEASKRRLAEHAYRAADQELLLRRESELTEVRSDFASLFELSHDLLCIAGMDGYFRRVNPAFERVLGYTEHELTATPFLRFVQFDDRRSTRKELDALGKKRPSIELVSRYRRKDGSYRRLERSAVSVPHNGALYAVARDLTDRMKSEERLQQLSNVVQQADDAVVITDRDGTIEYVNRAFEVTTGYSRHEALGKSPRILKSGKQDGEDYRRLWETILRGDTHRDEVVNRKKNGELYYAEQTITPMKEPDGRVTRVVSVVKDMTERRASRRRELEMELASRVQRGLYPGNPPRLAGFDLAGAVFFAQATCGDYFDFIGSNDRSLSMVVGDVCGHGVGPALLMAETRAYLRSLARMQSDTGEMLGAINEALASDFGDNHYVTLILGRLDPAAGRLTWANAGHIPGYVLDRSGVVKSELTACGLPLGLFHGSEYPLRENVAIDPGDVIVLLTDGITESEDRSGRSFGPEGVLEVLRFHLHEPAERMVVRVREAAEHFAQGQTQADDMTIVICKRLPVD